MKKGNKMEALRLHKIVEDDGQVFLENLPCKKGQYIEMIVLIESNDNKTMRPLTARQLRTSSLIGMWKDRDDIIDSASYARQLRDEAQNRRRC